MKTKIITSFYLFFLLSVKAQIGIDISILAKDAILQFGTEARGIKLTPVEDVTTMIASAGTVAFDGNTGCFRFLNDAGWSNTTLGGMINSGVPIITDLKTQGIIIGSKTSESQGVLILESANKALILPNVSVPFFQIPSPETGLMIYNSQNGIIDVFNGNFWVNY